MPSGRSRQFDFFFQAEDGIRDDLVTGVQTCALPISGRNFGCGSSREHAAWALQDYGFEVVIAPSFGDIFASNAAQIGLVVITLPEEEIRRLMEARRLTVDLEALTITDQFGRSVEFDFDPF